MTGSLRTTATTRRGCRSDDSAQSPKFNSTADGPGQGAIYRFNLGPKTLRTNRYFRLVALLLLLTVSSGCVWLRMLELKSQLGHFDENFKIDNGKAFTLKFLHPLLYSEDYLTLAKVEPTSRESHNNEAQWTQVFHKLNAEGKRETGREVVFTLHFNRKERLEAWEFSPTFVAMIPPRFLEASLRSLGKGNVDQGKKQLRVNPEDLPKVESKPPTRDEIIAKLGEPAEKSMENGLKLHVYRFETETSAAESGYEDRRNASAKLFYDPKSHELQKVTARFLGLKFSVDFRKFIQLEALGRSETP